MYFECLNQHFKEVGSFGSAEEYSEDKLNNNKKKQQVVGRRRRMEKADIGN